MPVKTITIDMEAYELLAAEKRAHESFSKVIKRRFGAQHTAADLLAQLDEVSLAEETLDAVEDLVRARRESPAESPPLDLDD